MKRTIDIVTAVRASAPEVAATLENRTAAVLGSAPAAAAPPGAYRTALHVDGRHGFVGHDVVVRLAPAGRPSSGRWRLTMEPVGSGRLLPSFEGTITSTAAGGRTDLRLTGGYEPPLGAVGRFGDGVLGHRIARQSLEAFLVDVARRVEREADAARSARRSTRSSAGVAPLPIDRREKRALPENWLG